MHLKLKLLKMDKKVCIVLLIICKYHQFLKITRAVDFGKGMTILSRNFKFNPCNLVCKLH